MEWPLVTALQIRAKHSGCRSQYLHIAKKAITELYKLNMEDPTAVTGALYRKTDPKIATTPKTQSRSKVQNKDKDNSK